MTDPHGFDGARALPVRPPSHLDAPAAPAVAGLPVASGLPVTPYGGAVQPHTGLQASLPDGPPVAPFTGLPGTTGRLGGAQPQPTAEATSPVRSADLPVAAPYATTPGVQEGGVRLGRVPTLDDLLAAQIDAGASDLHLTAGAPPMVRVRKSLVALSGHDNLTPKAIEQIVYGVLDANQRAKYERQRELDLSHVIAGVARFRVNVLRQRGSVGSVIRHIPARIRTLHELGIDEVVASWARLQSGLVLVTGPNNSGKTATTAAIIDEANRTREDKILTIEDPIEYEHQHRSCLIDQREVGDDTDTFATALRHALRQNPQIIFIGEMRDLETIQAALTAAESGVLVIATLHSRSAQETVTRIIDVFPANEKDHVKAVLAATLQGVCSQTLVENADGDALVPITEIMVPDAGIRTLIREDRTHQIPSALQTGRAERMHTRNQDLADKVLDGTITYETAQTLLHTRADRDDFETLSGGRVAVNAAARTRTLRARGGLGGSAMGSL
jgi:twitching motility protein PilT